MKRLFVFMVLLAVGFGMTQAQELTSGALEGVVQDQDGNPIADALVSAIGPQGIKTTTTDKNGRYNIRGLVSGSEYKVRAEAPGYAAMIQSEVVISINTRTQLPFTLNKGVTEEVTVISQAPIVDLKSTTTGDSFKIDNFAPYVPLGRNLVSVMSIAPGVSDGGTIGAQNASISGSSGLENAYFVDGVNITNSGFGALGSYSIVYGSLGTGVTYDFLEEVQVKTGGFEAEYGQAGGGVVNSVVRSGTNSFQLNFAAYAEPSSLEGDRGDRLDSPNIANADNTERTDISLSAAGPIIKDKLFYFAAYNPVTQDSTWKLTSGDPGTEYYMEDTNDDGLICDGSGRCYDIAAGNSIDSGNVADNALTFDVGNTVAGGRTPSEVTRTRSIDNYAAKLSWFMTPNHKFELTAFGDPSTGDVGPQAPTQFLRNLTDPIAIPDPTTGATGLDYGGDQLSFKYQGVFTPNFFLELLVASKENNFEETGPGTTFRSFFDVQNNTTFGGAGFYEGKVDESDQISLKLTNILGPVELRYGASYEDMSFKDPSYRSGPTYNAYLANVNDVAIDADGDGNPDVDTDGEPIYGLGFVNAGCLDGTNTNNPACYGLLPSSTGAAVDIDAPGVYNVTRTAFEPLDSVTTNEETNFFAQVSWDVISNLTIKAGLRYTEQKLQGSGEFTLGLGVTDVSHRPTGIYSTDYSPKTYTFDSEIAPRLGVAWDVMNNGKHKLYANYGEYFQRVPSDLAVRQFSNEVGVEGEQFAEGGLTTPLMTNACWRDVDQDGVYETQGPCHLIDGLTGAEPGIILDGTQLTEGSTVNDALGDNDAYVTAEATRLPQTKEYLLGYAWEINDYTGLEVRYISREIGRVMEDVQFASNEQIWNEFYGGLLFPNYGGEVFSGHGVGSFGAYTLANVGGNVDSTLFPIPVRDYQSFEVVYKRRFKDSWMAYVNYRYSELEGNYEGSYRNDNGQSDPFITSLFDLPAASALSSGTFVESDTLKGQYTIGPLNTDRANILNAFISKQFDFGLNVGVRTTMRTGQPRFPLFAHPTYRNAGEIPGTNADYWWGVWVDNANTVDATALNDGCDPVNDSWCEDGIVDNDLMGWGVYDNPDSTLNTMPDLDYDEDGNVDTAVGIATGPRLFDYEAVPRDYFGRNPATFTWDIHLSYDFKLRGGKSNLVLLLDVFNLFNEAQALTFDNNIETRPGNANIDYLKANLFQGPRNVRLGLRFTY